MSSGVHTDPACEKVFKQLIAGATRYIIFKIEDEKTIVVETSRTTQELGVEDNLEDYKSNSKKAYQAFLKDLDERANAAGVSDCRYAVFDFKFNSRLIGAEAISKADQIIFIQYCPDNAPVKKRMIYAASASAIKKVLEKAKTIQMQASEHHEIAHEEVLSKLV